MGETTVTEINTIDPFSRQIEDDNSDSSINVPIPAIRFSDVSTLILVIYGVLVPLLYQTSPVIYHNLYYLDRENRVIDQSML